MPMLELFRNALRNRNKTLVETVADTQDAEILHEKENEVWMLSSLPITKEIHKKGGSLGVLEELESLPNSVVPENFKSFFIEENNELKPKEGFYIQYFRHSDDYLNDIYLRHAVATYRA